MKEMSADGVKRHRRFLEAHRQAVASEAELVASLVAVEEGLVFRELGYASVHDYASGEVGFSRSKTDALLRLGRALRELPLLEAAFEDGVIEWSKLREIVRVASCSTEAEWLVLGKGSSYREIEKLCARTSFGFPPGTLKDGDSVRLRTRRLSLQLSDECASLLEEAIEALRGDGDSRLDVDAAVIELLARAASGNGEKEKEAFEGKASKVFDPRRRPWILLEVCPSCKTTKLQTREGEVEVSDVVREKLADSALVIDAGALVREAEAVYAERRNVPRGSSGWKRSASTFRLSLSGLSLLERISGAKRPAV